MNNQTFYDLYKKGEVSEDEMDNYVDEWNNSDTNESLREYLGMEDMQDIDYSNFIVHGTCNTTYWSR